MAGTLVVGTLSDGSASKTLVDVLKSRIGARVTFNGQGTVAINASDNVSSITDLGTGYYQVNFSTAMANKYYTTLGMAQRTGDYSDIPVSLKSGSDVTQSTTQVKVITCDVGGSMMDPILMTMAIVI